MNVVAGTLLVQLLLPKPAAAQVARFTVGPGGSHATIQAAVDACVSGVFTDIDVYGPATYTENLVIPSSLAAGWIKITGGWDATFTTRNAEPANTVIDGGATDTVVDVRISGGEFLINGFTITNGGGTSYGAGVRVLPSGPGNPVVTLENLNIKGNHASAAASTQGGGVWAQLGGGERLVLKSCNIRENSVTVTAGTGAAIGGGVKISAVGSSTFLIERCWIEDNTATSATSRKDGAGHFVSLLESASGELFDLRVNGNTAAGAFATATGSGGHIYLEGNSQVTVRRSAWAMNVDSTGDASEQLRLSCFDASGLLVTDSAVALGDQQGLYGLATTTATLRLVNLTVADNTQTGVQLSAYDSSTVTIYNSISYGNGTDAMLGAGVGSGSNLIGVDPQFMAPGPPLYNYRLGVGSPAVNTGNNSPPGGLGTGDLDNRSRVQNGVVDIGCYEGEGVIFTDGFEGGGTGEWSASTP